MVSPVNHRLHRFEKQITQIFILAACYLLHVGCSYAQSEKYIRVAIVQNAQTLNLKVAGSYEITDSTGEKVLLRGRNLKTTVITSRGGILMAGRFFDNYKITIKVSDPDIIIINGRKFRGNIQLTINNDANLLVVNHIELEDYIKGILYHEASHYWPMEALLAQAIISRTYAVYQMQENKLKNYDVTSDIYSQVYGGKSSERSRTNKAVDLTLGQILTFQEKVIPAYFHATCGGYTEDASMLWNIDILPLKGVPCSFCKDSPHFNWHYVLTLDEIEEKLTKAGLKTGRIKDIAILTKDKSGRVTDLNMVSSKKDLKISAKDFRNIIGPNIIRSTNFTVKVIKQDAVFEGVGWGHGVGLCQWGAYFMAKQGYTAEQILKYYYPGIDVRALRF